MRGLIAALGLWSATVAAGEPAPWSAVVLMQDGAPAACGIAFSAPEASLRVEKRRGADGILTVLRVRGSQGPVVEAALRTASVDTTTLLSPSPAAGDVYVASAMLEGRIEGGALLRELAVTGGTLEWTTGADARVNRMAIRGPAPRDVTAAYLNCAGDLVAP